MCGLNEHGPNGIVAVKSTILLYNVDGNANGFKNVKEMSALCFDEHASRQTLSSSLRIKLRGYSPPNGPEKLINIIVLATFIPTSIFILSVCVYRFRSARCLAPRVDQESVETVEMPRIGSTQTIDTTDSSSIYSNCQFIHQKCRLLFWDVLGLFIINSFYCIATDNDGIADIAHEVLHKIYSYAILNYHCITFRMIS